MLFVENVGIRWLRLETHITHMTHVVLVHVLQLEKMPWRCRIHDRLSVIAKECKVLMDFPQLTMSLPDGHVESVMKVQSTHVIEFYNFWPASKELLLIVESMYSFAF